MKTKCILILITSILFIELAAQDPLQDLLIKRDYAKMESLLTTYGKAAYEKEKNDYAKLSSPKFKIAPNPVMNNTLKQNTGEIQPIGDNSAEVKSQLDKNKKAITAAKEDLARLKITWNLKWLDDITLYSLNQTPILCGLNRDILTPVKDQKGCGSCWAFAAAAAWEHTHKKIYGPSGYTTTHNLSEEDLVRCGFNCDIQDCGSCENGGHSDKAFDYITCKKTTNEAGYPYTATDGSCGHNMLLNNYGAYGWSQISSNNNFPSRQDIKAAINEYGAVVSYVHVGKGWGGYDTGVLNAEPSGSNSIQCYNEDTKLYESCPNNVNHAVVIVGWCDALNAWIIKNSWGTNNWGSYGGYAYVDYNSYNIGRYVYWVFPMFHQ